MSYLEGLPPLPKSLSGLNVTDLTWQTRSSSLSLSSPDTTTSYRTAPSREVTPSSSFAGKRTPTPRSAGGSPLQGGRGPPPPPPPRYYHLRGRQGRLYSLDSRLALLRKEMFALRQMDLSLLNQLWALNEAIQEFRTAQESGTLGTPPSEESDDDEEEYLSVNNRLPLSLNSTYRRSSDEDSSIEYGNV